MRRRGVFTAGLVLAGSALIAWIIATVLVVRSDLTDEQNRADALNTNLDRSQDAVDALAQQVKGLGATPVATPSLVPVPGPAGPAGLSITGPRGLTGPAGAPGKDSTIPGPAGSPGARGADSTVPGPAGSPGAKGDPGADSTVPGPAGSPGAQGNPGPDQCEWQDDKFHPGYQVCTRPSPTPAP